MNRRSFFRKAAAATFVLTLPKEFFKKPPMFEEETAFVSAPETVYLALFSGPSEVSGAGYSRVPWNRVKDSVKSFPVSTGGSVTVDAIVVMDGNAKDAHSLCEFFVPPRVVSAGDFVSVSMKREV